MHLGVHTECVDGSECRQMSLFDGNGDYEKQKCVEMAVDALRKRFGIDSINESPNRDKENLIDHMSGGISHEKRTVDYEKEIIVEYLPENTNVRLL